MNKQEYEDHPLSSVLPMMGQMEIRELAADIQANGLRAPITLLDGKILDGRNRYKACQIVDVEPRFRDFNGDGDPLDFIVSVNVKRRHLTSPQREMVAAKLANMPRGDNSRFSEGSSHTAIWQYGETLGKTTIAQAAKELGVSPRSVARARGVLRTAPAEEIAAIEQGKKKVGTVARETKEKAEAKEKHADKTGYPIPDDVFEDWREAESFSDLLRDLHRIKLRVEKAVDEDELVFREISNTTVATLKHAWSELQQILPYAVCPTCQGRARKKCTVCKQRGFVSEFGYKHWFPKETLELREKAIQEKAKR